MITVSAAVERVVRDDGFIIEAIQRGVVNLSAYADTIHRQIEEATMKPVARGTLIVALTRLQQRIQNQPSLTPHVSISSMGVHTNICEITYERTDDILKKLHMLKNLDDQNTFFTTTQGMHEVTFICEESERQRILTHFTTEPKARIEDLVAISVRFNDTYIDVANTIYSLVGILATKHVNIMEIVSTYTEITFIIFARDMECTMNALTTYTKK